MKKLRRLEETNFRSRKNMDDLTSLPIAKSKNDGINVLIRRDYSTQEIVITINSKTGHGSCYLSDFLSLKQIYEICKIIEED